MKHYRKFFFSAFFSLLSLAAPAQAWELCLDLADFSFSADAFLRSTRVSKTACEMRFVALVGKGERYELNLCDPIVHIDQFPAIDATSYTRHYAGSGGCPKPLFGADNDEEKEGDLKNYLAVKGKVLDIFESVRKVYGPNSATVNIKDPKNFGVNGSDAKIACAKFLLDQYLNECVSFQALRKEFKRPETKEAPPPGIHPEVIKK